MSEIKSIDIGNMCLESYPCQHNCTITYSDGRVVRFLMDGRSISLGYWDFLTEDQKRHFLDYKNN